MGDIGTLQKSLLAALLALLALGWPLEASADRVARLIRILRQDPSYKVRLRVVITLTRIKDPRVPPALDRALGDRHHLVRALAARALADVGATSSLARVRRVARRDPHRYTRRMAARAARALARRGNPRFYVNVGAVHDRSGKGGPGAVARFKAALLAEFSRVPGVTTRLAGDHPDPALLRKRKLRGFVLSGSIRRLAHRRDGPRLRLDAAVRVELATYPGNSMKAFYAGEASMEVTSHGPTRAKLQGYFLDLLAGAAREARSHIMSSYLSNQ